MGGERQRERPRRVVQPQAGPADGEQGHRVVDHVVEERWQVERAADLGGEPAEGVAAGRAVRGSAGAAVVAVGRSAGPWAARVPGDRRPGPCRRGRRCAVRDPSAGSAARVRVRAGNRGKLAARAPAADRLAANAGERGRLGHGQQRWFVTSLECDGHRLRGSSIGSLSAAGRSRGVRKRSALVSSKVPVWSGSVR